MASILRTAAPFGKRYNRQAVWVKRNDRLARWTSANASAVKRLTSR
jgi:hypothetical protein